MKWFGGSIEDAITAAKERKSYFIVYVEGSDDSSEIMTSILNTKDISDILESQNHVCVRLRSDSGEYRQFVEIYKHVPIPSLFFFSVNGFPLAVVTHSAGEDTANLREQILKVISPNVLSSKPLSLQTEGITSKIDECASGSNNLQSAEPKARVSHKSISDDVVTNVISFNVSSCGGHMSSTAGSAQLSTENVSTTEMLLAAVQEASASTETNEGQQKTTKPLKMGKSSSLFKRRLDSQEAARLQEIQQAKIRNEKDRQRILNDIAIDKQERIARQNELDRNKIQHTISEVTENGASVENCVLPSPLKNTRIQFRMPDGTTRTELFNVNCEMNDLRRYVIDNIQINTRQFSLATAFPRHVFTDDESNKTLEELHLVPNAVILIMLSPENRGLTSILYSSVNNILWILSSPIMFISRFIQTTFSRQPPPLISQGVLLPRSSNENHVVSDVNYQSRPQGSSSNQSNVHTIGKTDKKKKGSDKNNVWNGNSTQQSQ